MGTFSLPGLAALLVWATTLAGCRVSGRWQLRDTKPEGAAFPFHAIQLAPGGEYQTQGLFSATGDFDGKPHTVSGSYSRSPGSLSLSPTNGPTVSYRTYRRLDGKLVLSLALPGPPHRVTAVFEPPPE